MKCSRKFCWFLLGLAIVVTSPAAAEGDWEGEVGLLFGQHDNFFFRGEGNPAPESDLLTGYVVAERTWKRDASRFALELSGSAVDVSDIPNANYQSYGIAGTYRRGSHRFQLGHSQLLNRLYSESGEAVFFDESAFDLQWRVTLGTRWWVRLRFQTSEWDFDAAENERDSDTDRTSLTARVAVHPKLGLRFGWIDESRTATGPENNREGDGFEVAFEGTPSETLTWFLRFRSRDRDYLDALPDDRNFGRSDTTDEINFNVRWTVTEQLGLYVRDNYRDGSSTRLDRNYTGNVAEVGIFFAF